MNAQSNLANILSQQGNAAFGAGNSYANALSNLAGFQQQGGINQSSAQQQALANELNLLGQRGQAQAGTTMGAYNARQQANQNMLNLVGAGAGAILGIPG